VKTWLVEIFILRMEDSLGSDASDRDPPRPADDTQVLQAMQWNDTLQSMSASAFGTAHLNRGYGIALASSAILSTTAIFIRHLTQVYRMPALVLAFWRDGIVVLTLLMVLGFLRPFLLQATRRHLWYLIAYGFALGIFNALWTLSVSVNGAAVATVLVYCSAAFTALLGWWFLNERLDLTKVAAVACSLGGCVLVAEAVDAAVWRLHLASILTGVLSGLLYAVYSLMGRSASQRGLNPWTTLTYTFGFAAIFLLFFNLGLGHVLPGGAARPADLLWLGDALAGWGILLLLAAGPTVAGFGLYNVSLGYLPSSVANLILTSEPVFTAVIACFLLGERLSGMQLGGGLMILGGVSLLRMYERRLAVDDDAHG
jgi:drug/metabolite transporter (DMT)-like permease